MWRLFSRRRPALWSDTGADTPNARPKRVRDPNRPLLFLHIPKSAGTSFTQSLAAAVRPRKPILGAFDSALFGTFNDFESMSPAERERIYIGSRRLPEDADFVAGHIALKTFLDAYPNGQLVTIMREPISRLLSHWAYWRSQKDEDLVAVGSWAERVRIARRPLHDFLRSDAIIWTTDNLYVRMLLHPHPNIPLSGCISRENDAYLLQEALRALRRFSLIDFLENPAFTAQVSSWLGVPFALSKDNVTTAVAQEHYTTLYDELGADTLTLLEERTRLDRALWLHVLHSRQPKLDSSTIERAAIIRTILRMERLLRAQ